MAIDGEPKDGDFARYIETLSNSPPPRPPAVPSLQTPVTAPSHLSDTHWVKNPSTQSPQAPPGSSGDAPTSEPTLASQARRNKLSNLLSLASFWIGFGALFSLIKEGSFYLDDIAPFLLMSFFAIMLFKGARRLRASSKEPLKSLPPLKIRPRDEY